MSLPRPSRRERLLAAGVCALALVLRVLAVVQFEAHHPLADRPVIDERSYEEWGKEIAAGDWMGGEVFFQEPLYPYFVGAVYACAGESRTALRLVQAGLGALAALLVWALARRLFGPAPALLAALALATYRPALLLPCLLLKPNLFVPLIAGLALVLAEAVARERTPGRRGASVRWLCLGALGGLGALLRGNALILLPALALAPLVCALRGGGRAGLARLAACGAVALGAALPLVPVALRNHAVGGVFALTTSGAGTNVYGGNNPQNPHGTPKEFDWVRGIPEFEAEDWRHEAERRLGRALSPTEVSSFWLAETGRSALADPLLHLSILWSKLRLTLGAYEVPDNHHLEWDARFVPLLGLPLPGWALWGTLALAGMALAAAGRPRPLAAGPASLLLLFLAYLATIVLTVTSMRARLALVPLALPFAGRLLADLPALVRPPRRLLAPLVALGLSAAAVLAPVLDAGERERKLAARDFNFITYRLDAGAPAPELLALVDELDRRYPGTLRIWSLRAEVLLRMARETVDRERARELALDARARVGTVIERSGSNARERHRADLLGGEVELFLGEPALAAGHLRRALAFDPEDPRARRALGDALLGLAAGRGERLDPTPLREAEAEYRRALAESPDEPGARLGLANALWLSSSLARGDARAAALRECEELLEALHRGGEPVSELLERVRAASR